MNQNIAPTKRGTKMIFWLYILFALVAVFYLPTLFPGKQVEADSYIFGYNNHIGFLLFVVFTFIGAFWSQVFHWNLSPPASSNKVSPKTLWICLGGVCIICFFIYILTSRLSGYGESTYFINRIELTAKGMRPYLDFEFAYGPLFIYIPLAISRCFHITIPNAYYLFWALCHLGGTWTLAIIINKLDFGSLQKNQVFILLYMALLPGYIYAGINYTAGRFLLAPLLGLMLYQILQSNTMKSYFFGVFFTTFSAALLLAVSPEIGVGFSISAISYYILCNLRTQKKHWILPLAILLALLAALILEANHFQLFYLMRHMEDGGFNFPIIPSEHILLFFFSVFVAASYFARNLLCAELRSNTTLLLLISVPSLAACLGRCDPGHVLYDGIIIFMFVLLCTSNLPRIWGWYRAAFVLIFVILSGISTLSLYKNEFGRAVISYLINSPALSNSRLGTFSNTMEKRAITSEYGRDGMERLSQFKAKAMMDARLDIPRGLSNHLHGVANVPFSYTATHNPQGLDFGFYDGLIDVFDPQAVKAKIAELEQTPDRALIMPAQYDKYCLSYPNQHRENMISALFMFPFHNKVVHTQNLYAPLCSYIDEHYDVAVPWQQSVDGYSTWIRKP
ncbi:hypothetical protein ACOBR2_21070 (plasmid) [Telmatobacter bradus]|uniref:hypothetical protein n=1 Tax=Telmatobacter bradus TaxID=474953 RepID=UPI003B427C3D